MGTQHPIPSAQDGLRIVGAGALGSLVEAFGQVLDASLTSGQTYNLTGYFTSLVGTGEFDVFVSSGDPVDDAIVVGSIGGSAVEGSWTFDALEFVSPVDATFFGFRVRLISGGFLYLSCDDLDLTRSDPVPVFDESWGRIKSHFGPNAQ